MYMTMGKAQLYLPFPLCCCWYSKRLKRKRVPYTCDVSKRNTSQQPETNVKDLKRLRLSSFTVVYYNSLTRFLSTENPQFNPFDVSALFLTYNKIVLSWKLHVVTEGSDTADSHYSLKSYM